MDTILIIAIVVVAVLLIAWLATRARGRKLEQRREEAHELRSEASRRHQVAERERTAAAEQARRADELDPDTDTDTDTSDRETTPTGRERRF